MVAPVYGRITRLLLEEIGGVSSRKLTYLTCSASCVFMLFVICSIFMIVSSVGTGLSLCSVHCHVP